MKKLIQYCCSTKGAKIILGVWIVLAGLLVAFAPSSKEYSVSIKGNSVKQDNPSYIAHKEIMKEFPSDGLTALLVFHREKGLTADDKLKITELSKWLSSDEKPKSIKAAIPFHQLPPPVQDTLYSEDKSTLMLSASLKSSSDSTHALDTVKEINAKVKELKMDGVQFEITGPAGITADTKEIFKNADFVLMMGTVILIFIILVAIYRSPILAVTPLVISGIVYLIVDRILGIAGEQGWFTIDVSALSIMLVLLFAVLTDYSLFIFSRYREELGASDSKYSAMTETMQHMFEPIFFSGGTVFLAVLTLFVTVFQPYHYFAPVFSVAMAVILLAGVTLVPSIFAIMGPKAFWPFIPKAGKQKAKSKVWAWVGQTSTKRPWLVSFVLFTTLTIGAVSVLDVDYSFNTLKSFPSDMSSRKGLELLGKHYSQGDIAPVTVMLKSENVIRVDADFLKKVQKLQDELLKDPAIVAVNPELAGPMLQNPKMLPKDFISNSKQAVKLQVVLRDNPYDVVSLDKVEEIRNETKALLENSGFDTSEFKVYVGGQTVEQVDTRDMNVRDTWLLIGLVTLLITTMLSIQTRSIPMALLMMFSILLSFAATIGFSWLLIKYGLGDDAISYRLPVYTFVFMVALGVDYNIMLVSRIKEQAKIHPWKEAVAHGVELTGGVISSAGVILAATFAVLITQPLQELSLFGLTMAFGILMDTFIVRGFFLPALLVIFHRDKK